MIKAECNAKDAKKAKEVFKSSTGTNIAERGRKVSQPCCKGNKREK